MASPSDFVKWKAIHDPYSTLDYSLDWSMWLEPGDLIATSDFQTPTGLTIESSNISESRKKTTVWLSGGKDSANPACVQNTITTTAGRTVVKSIILEIGPS